MCAQRNQSPSFSTPAAQSVLQAIGLIAEAKRRSYSIEECAGSVVQAVVEQLPVERCTVWRCDGSPLEGQINLSLLSEQFSPSLAAIESRHFSMPIDSSLAHELTNKKRFRLSEIPHSEVFADGHGSWEAFICQCSKENSFAFPIAIQNKLIGFLTLHFREDAETVSPVILQFGDLLASDLIDSFSGQAQRLAKQLSWERWARQMIAKLHSTLDRDVLLQTVVDGLGKWLHASRCFVIRAGNPVSVATHEFAEPEFSPLGLGRTSQFPQALIDKFRESLHSFSDLSSIEQVRGLSEQDLRVLAENGINSIVGVPINFHGTNYGAIVALQCGLPRQWTNEETEAIALTAEQTGLALSHCEEFNLVKEQLFHMNLLSNLTEQITAAVDLLNKTAKPQREEEKPLSAGGTIPLSYRELEVLRLIASGYANREVAQRLFLTESTVELHASRIRKKLNLKTRTALVKYACDHALV
jgi:DNA-binding CsgD family transcriptional regulator